MRANTAYDRFWEGRKMWSQIQHSVRQAARIIWFTVKDDDTDAHAAQVSLEVYVWVRSGEKRWHMKQKDEPWTYWWPI